MHHKWSKSLGGTACSFDVDRSRFPKSGGVYESPDFDTAENRVAIGMDVAAASASVR